MKRIFAIVLTVLVTLAIFLGCKQSTNFQKAAPANQEKVTEDFVCYHKIDGKIFVEYLITSETSSFSSCRTELREVKK